MSLIWTDGRHAAAGPTKIGQSRRWRGGGKSRLALELGLRVPPGWAAGWLHVGAGGAAVDAVRACADPALILVEEADGREDLAALLESLARQPGGRLVRVVLITRSPQGLPTAAGRRLEERHAWTASGR